MRLALSQNYSKVFFILVQFYNDTDLLIRWFSRILFSRIPNLFHEICCFFWSPLNRFLIENQNMYSKKWKKYNLIEKAKKITQNSTYSYSLINEKNQNKFLWKVVFFYLLHEYRKYGWKYSYLLQEKFFITHFFVKMIRIRIGIWVVVVCKIQV